MRKYQTGFKLKVVNSFLDGDGGAKLLARQWSVPEGEEKIRTMKYPTRATASLAPPKSLKGPARPHPPEPSSLGEVEP